MKPHMPHHMPHPIRHMKRGRGMKHHMLMRHHKRDKAVACLTLAALGTLTVVNILQLREAMMRRNDKSPLQDKIEHVQRCFERLMEHS